MKRDFCGKQLDEADTFFAWIEPNALWVDNSPTGTGPSELPPPDLVYTLFGINASQRSTFDVGQEIVFTGTVQLNSAIDMANTLEITNTTVAPIGGLPVPVTSTANLEDTTITLQRGTCYGWCPVYGITIYGDGSVQYIGAKFVTTHGERSGSISKDSVKALVAEFEKVRFYSLRDSYTNYFITDAPYVTISISMSGKSKTVSHYLGDLSAPRILQYLEGKIDEITNSDQWVKNGPDPIDKFP